MSEYEARCVQNGGVLNCRAATALIRAMGMAAENQHRVQCGKSIAYGEEAFEKVIVEEGVHWNFAATLLQQ